MPADTERMAILPRTLKLLRRWRASVHRLRVRLTLLVVLAIVPAIVLALYMASQQYRHAQVSVQGEMLRVAHGAAKEHEGDMGATRRLLRLLADRLPASSGGNDCGKGLLDVVTPTLGLARLQVLRDDGVRVCAWAHDADPVSPAEIAAAREAIAANDFAVQIPRSAATPADAVVHLAFPRRSRAGRPSEALVATYDLTVIGRLLPKDALPEGATIGIVDASGRILYRYPDPQKWIGKQTGADFRAALFELRNGGAIEGVDRDGYRRLFAFAPIRQPETGQSYYLNVGVPTESAYRGITFTLLLTLAGLGVVLLGVLALGWISGNVLIAHPIGKIVAAARKIGAGDLGARSGLPTTPGEIGELSSAFDTMAEHLAARQHELLEVGASLRRSEASFRTLTETMASGVIVYRGTTIAYANPHAEKITGYSRAELIATPIDALIHPSCGPQVLDRIAARMAGEELSPRMEVRLAPRNGRECWVDIASNPTEFGGEWSVLATFIDITEHRAAEVSLRRAHESLERLVEQRTAELVTRNKELTAVNQRLADAQGQLMQSEKLASIGQLAAGVAHEINNPIAYVHSNLASLEQYVADALALIAQYEALESAIADPAALAAVRSRKEAIDLAFLREDLPHLLIESHEGITRVRKIVQDLKDFSRVDRTHEREQVDLHHCLDSTLNVASFELKYRADIVKDYGNLPEIECVPSQLNQVFMNLLLNAAQATDGPRGTITIRTRADAGDVVVEIEDTGVGIKPEHLTRIFDPFFTTKPVGKGTGLGLSLVYAIVQQHGGCIDVDSTLGKGTVFRLTLPVRGASADETVEADAVATIDA